MTFLTHRKIMKLRAGMMLLWLHKMVIEYVSTKTSVRFLIRSNQCQWDGSYYPGSLWWLVINVIMPDSCLLGTCRCRVPHGAITTLPHFHDPVRYGEVYTYNDPQRCCVNILLACEYMFYFQYHDDVMTWRCFPHYCPFLNWIHRAYRAFLY